MHRERLQLANATLALQHKQHRLIIVQTLNFKIKVFDSVILWVLTTLYYIPVNESEAIFLFYFPSCCKWCICFFKFQAHPWFGFLIEENQNSKSKSTTTLQHHHAELEVEQEETTCFPFACAYFTVLHSLLVFFLLYPYLIY